MFRAGPRKLLPKAAWLTGRYALMSNLRWTWHLKRILIGVIPGIPSIFYQLYPQISNMVSCQPAIRLHHSFYFKCTSKALWKTFFGSLTMPERGRSQILLLLYWEELGHRLSWLLAFKIRICWFHFSASHFCQGAREVCCDIC